MGDALFSVGAILLRPRHRHEAVRAPGNTTGADRGFKQMVARRGFYRHGGNLRLRPRSAHPIYGSGSGGTAAASAADVRSAFAAGSVTRHPLGAGFDWRLTDLAQRR